MSKAVNKMTYEEKLAFIHSQCRTNLKYLATRILGMDDWGGLHDDLERYLKASGNRKLILIPRGHLKSSIISIAYVIQQILRNPNIRVLIANAVWDNARKFMWKIQEYLTDKSVLSQLFGKFESKRWNSDEFVDLHRTKAHAEPTVATTGVEKTQTSQHYDLIVMDDLVVRENISTKDQREKVITFYKDTLDLLEPGGELIVVGTRWAMGDLYQHIIENEMKSINGHKLNNVEERKKWRDKVAA